MCCGINRDKFAILIWTITIIFHANSFNTRASVNLFQNMFLKSGFPSESAQDSLHRDTIGSISNIILFKC